MASQVNSGGSNGGGVGGGADLDTILKGLQIAATGYGLYADTQKLHMMKAQQQQSENESAAKEKDAQAKAADTARISAGLYNTGEIQKLGTEGNEISSTPFEPGLQGVIKAKVQRPDGAIEDVYIKPKSVIERINHLIDAKSADELRKSTLAIAASDRRDKENERLREAMGNSMDPDKARAGNFADISKKVKSAERLEALVQSGNGNLDSRQIEEMAIGLNTLLSGSNAPAATQIKALVPETALGNAMKMKEWISNNPTGTNQQAFVNRMMDTVKREKELAQHQLLDIQHKRLSIYEKLKEHDPEGYHAILRSYGVENEDGLDPDSDPRVGVSAPALLQEKKVPSYGGFDPDAYINQNRGR